LSQPHIYPIHTVKKTANPYRFFNAYCSRTPIFPFSFYKKLTKGTSISAAKFKELRHNKVINEALFLASPVLYAEIDKFTKNQIVDIKKIERVQFSFLKYLSRMATRCTPFGLFAACSIGELAETTSIKLNPSKDFVRQTRFDMNFLVALAQELSKKSDIAKHLLFYPNSSIYKAGRHLRYIEYTYQNNQRVHSIEGIGDTPYLQKILRKAHAGKKLKDLANCLVSERISFDEAMAFINELVENQLLVSELEPSVSGGDFLDQIIDILQNIAPKNLLLNELKVLSDSLKYLDKQLGNPIQGYLIISQSIKTIKIPFELKYLFQTDLYTLPTTNQISKSSLLAIKKGMKLLNKMTLPPIETPLDRFKKAFVKRYGTREVPLSLALDIEMGIGYIQNQEIADDTPILDDLQLHEKKKKSPPIIWTKTDDVLQRKLNKAIVNNAFAISISDSDFIDFMENWDDLPTTMSSLLEISFVDDKEVIYFNAVSGSSGANLLARFSDGNEQIYQHTQNIISRGDSKQSNKIDAEIVHLPEARIGNILRRPQLRKFEIPYLAKSNLPIENQIGINDLMISVRKDSIVLASKKHKKEIIPHLTNAHNFGKNSLPIYHLLCDLQNQSLRSSIYFSWGNVAKNQSFLPRVIYTPKGLKETIIFSKAQWVVDTKEIDTLLKPYKHWKELLQSVEKWRKELKMPQYVQLVESDNTLLINLKNSSCVQMLLSTIKNKERFVLEEFLFDKGSIVKSKESYFTNQFVFSFYKS